MDKEGICLNCMKEDKLIGLMCNLDSYYCFPCWVKHEFSCKECKYLQKKCVSCCKVLSDFNEFVVCEPCKQLHCIKCSKLHPCFMFKELEEDEKLDFEAVMRRLLKSIQRMDSNLEKLVEVVQQNNTELKKLTTRAEKIEEFLKPYFTVEEEEKK